MNEQLVIDITLEAMVIMAIISAPLLAVAMVVGLVVSVLQAATQVNEMTLTFTTKFFSILGVLALTANWMVQKWTDFMVEIFALIEQAGR